MAPKFMFRITLPPATNELSRLSRLKPLSPNVKAADSVVAGVGTPTPAVQTLADHSSVKQPGTFLPAPRFASARSGVGIPPRHDGVARLSG